MCKASRGVHALTYLVAHDGGVLVPTKMSNILISEHQQQPVTHVQLRSQRGHHGEATGSDVNVRDKFNIVPLMLVEKADVLKVLLAAGADINMQDVDGETALTYAVSNGRAEIAQLLVDAGADVAESIACARCGA